MPGSESGAPPRRTLSKLRRNKGRANASTLSLASASADGDDNSSDAGLRAPGDSALDRIKDRARRLSVDRHGSTGSDDGAGSGRRLSSLIPRRKRSPKKDLLGLSAPSSDDGHLPASGNHSETSLVDESGHSSLLTEDNSDTEGRPTRPPLSPHQSHAGYLTLSSPELHSQSQPVAPANEPLPSIDTVHTAGPAVSTPRIVEPGDPDPDPLAPSADPHPTSPSLRRLKGAFNPSRKQAAGDTDSVKSASSTIGGSGSLFRSQSNTSSVKSPVPDDAAAGRSEAEPEPEPEPEASVREPEKSAVPATTSEGHAADTPEQRKRARVNTDALPATPPNLIETPTTLVTPPTPTDPNADASTFAARKTATSAAPSDAPASARPPSLAGNIRHRRAQSANLPSRLSSSFPPLTPTVEETKTPGGTLTQEAPTGSGGFFSSFFSAAHKAADQLSNSVNTSIGGQNKSKPGLAGSVEGGEEAIPGAQSRPGTADSSGGSRQAAVETLGQGNLSLSHLGIQDGDEPSPMTSAVDLPQQNAPAVNGDANRNAEDEAAARAVSVAFETPVQNVVSQATGRPQSVTSSDRLALVGDHTPPRPGTDLDGLKRSGSVRSKLSGRRGRHRNSSATTGTGHTIATALQLSSSALVNPAAASPGHRLTGFAVASSKRNKDFHQLFRSVPEDDYLIEDYSAALQRDILLQGRLYVSEAHVCFSSNILGWVTTLVINFDEVVSIEKKNTAVIFPNAIVIQTLHARNTFASLVTRDSTYELLIGIWKISHPNLKSSLNGVTLDNAGTGDKTEVADSEGTEEEEESGDGSDDEVYDEDEHEVESFTDAGVAPSAAASDAGDPTLSRKTSTGLVSGAPQVNGTAAKGAEGADAATAGAGGSVDFPGPSTHAPTECSDGADHYDKPLIDTIIAAPLGKVYSMLFGPASGSFMRNWLVENQKSRELTWPDHGLDNTHKTLVFEYIKPLNAPVGPRQTKCITTNTLAGFDLEKAISVDCSTQTPDVPSGSVFSTKTRYCLVWGPDNSTRMIASCGVEWTGKSWLKGPIEKGAFDGQMDYVKALVASVRAAVTTRPATKAGLKKGKRKGKKDVVEQVVTAQQEAALAASQKAGSWGLLEPLHPILEPLIALIRPFITSQGIIVVLLLLLVYGWVRSPRPGTNVGFPGYSSSDRLVAYEEIWQREESELWDWLDDRVGLDHVYPPALSKAQQERQRTLNAKGMKRKLGAERMSERQVDDAIRTTEERLAALKEAVATKKKEKKKNNLKEGA